MIKSVKPINRVAHFHKLFLNKRGQMDKLDVAPFERILTYLDSLEDKEKTYELSGMNLILSNISKRTSEGDYYSYKLTFGKFRTDVKPDIRNSATGKKRASDKSDDEGDEVNTHYLLYFPKENNEIKGKEIILLKESFNNSVLPNQALSYFKHFTSTFNKEHDFPSFIVKSEPIFCEDFLQALDSQENISSASFTVPRKYLGSSFLNFSDQEDIMHVGFDIKVEISSAENDSLKSMLKKFFKRKPKELKGIKFGGDEDDYMADIVNGEAIMEHKKAKRCILKSVVRKQATGLIDSDDIFDKMIESLNYYIENEETRN